MRLWLEADDVWLFRDARPFAAGDNHRAESRFPPHPTTIQGAIRTRLLLDSSTRVADYQRVRPPALVERIGLPNGAPPFTLRGPLLARRREGKVETLHPIPADLAKEKGGQRYHYLKPIVDRSLAANWPTDELRGLYAPTTERLEGVEGWLTPTQWQRYLRHDPSLLDEFADPGTAPLRPCHLFVREPRVGIALESKARRPQEGMLFEVEYIRPRAEVGLLVEVEPHTAVVREALEASFGVPGGRGWLTLGGERRLARWEVLEAEQPPVPASASRFRVVLLTPAFFDGGWQPTGGWDQFFGGSSVHLCAAAVGRPESISGWDVAAGVPRAAQPAVPAGSVYFFEGDAPVSLQKPFTQQRAGLGYGLCEIGVWNA